MIPRQVPRELVLPRCFKCNDWSRLRRLFTAMVANETDAVAAIRGVSAAVEVAALELCANDAEKRGQMHNVRAGAARHTPAKPMGPEPGRGSES